jgi:signal transduction histidine kinase/DNA-binding response OmpR family regulator
MAAMDQTVLDWRRDLQGELDELRRELLSTFMILAFAIGWLWFTYVTVTVGPVGRRHLPAVALYVGMAATFVLRKWNYRVASWAYVLSLALAVVLLIAVQPASLLALAFGTSVVVVANALLGGWPAFVAAMIMWTLGTIAWHSGRGMPLRWNTFDILALYLLTWAAAWLSARPLESSVELVRSSWQRVADAVAEARTRRGELLRVVRALEEATYRIERMNNELIVARREAEEARALKARFVATVSHELRSPLNLILGFSRLMALSPERYGAPLPSAYQADVDAIYRNSQHLSALVDDILDLTQIEAQRLPLVKDRISLEEDVIARAVSTVQPLADRKGLYIRQETAGNLPWVLADPVRLRQVVLNLLTNAIRFTLRGGVTIRASLRDDHLLVSIQDTGPGIPGKEMDNLFREFQQVQAAEKREEGGSGLGLAISKYLVELHGGQIGVESRVGVGTTFTFTVPLPGTVPLAADTVKTREVAPLTRGPQSCLVVHDDPALVRLLARYIEGYRVVGLPDGQEAMAMTDMLHPKAILTTPELAEAIHESLADTPYDVPVISCAMPRARDHARVEGLVHYLVKPVAPEAVAAVMRHVEPNGEATVLLVDDDPDAVRLLEHMLGSLLRPYRILRAYDGAQALEIMEQVIPDVLFLDLVMPRMDGFRTMAQMRADERLRQVPVVVVSGRNWVEETAVLGTSIHVRVREPMAMATGAKCLQGLLDGLQARYLPYPEPPPPSTPAPAI